MGGKLIIVKEHGARRLAHGEYHHSAIFSVPPHVQPTLPHVGALHCSHVMPIVLHNVAWT